MLFYEHYNAAVNHVVLPLLSVSLALMWSQIFAALSMYVAGAREHRIYQRFLFTAKFHSPAPSSFSPAECLGGNCLVPSESSARTSVLVSERLASPAPSAEPA
jgi:hypothetical protein